MQQLELMVPGIVCGFWLAVIALTAAAIEVGLKRLRCLGLGKGAERVLRRTAYLLLLIACGELLMWSTGQLVQPLLARWS